MLVNELVEVVQNLSLALGKRLHADSSEEPRVSLFGRSVYKQKAKIKLDARPSGTIQRVKLKVSPKASRAGHPDAVGFGVNTVDLVAQVDRHPEPDTKQPLRGFDELPGGETATAVTACARLGFHVRYVGQFGDDSRGQRARAALELEGVDLSGCETVSAPQPISVVIVDRQGCRTVLSSHPGNVKFLRPMISREIVSTGRLLLVDAHGTIAAAEAATLARAAGVPTIVDVDESRPGLDALFQQVDVLITSETFPEAFAGVEGIGAALTVLQRQYMPALVCATLGNRGSLALVDGQEIRTPAFDVPVVDSTGAGDAFRGGFMAAWLLGGSGADIENLLVYSNAVAALSCRGLGARAGLPRRDEVEGFLAVSKHR